MIVLLGMMWAQADVPALTEPMELPEEDILSSSIYGQTVAHGSYTEFGVLRPISGTDMTLLSTGVIGHEAQNGDDLGFTGTSDDATTLIVDLAVPDWANSFGVDFYFLSAEYPEWVGSPFNDAFQVWINGTAWSGNAAIDLMGNEVTVNSAFFTVTDNAVLAPCGFSDDGATDWVHLVVPVDPEDEIHIEFYIADVGDGVYDSTVLLDAFRWSTDDPDEPSMSQDCSDFAHLDTDGDGLGGPCDECPEGDDFIDTDADGVADACDACLEGDDNRDSDGDLIADACDECPGGDDLIDTDADTVPDACDLCPDGDDFADADSDGVADACDLCPAGDDRVDTDGDGFADACDLCVGGDDLADADGDTIPDDCDACPGWSDEDTDEDGVPEACEIYIDFLEPKRSPTQGMIEVSVVGGANLTSDCVVQLDGVAQQTTFVSATELSFRPVAHEAGLVDVGVRCGIHSALLIGGFSFYESTSGMLPPTVSSVTPSIVDAGINAEVTVEGLNFLPGAELDLNSVPVPTSHFTTKTVGFVVDSSWGAGVIDVGLTNPDGQRDMLPAAVLVLEPETAEPPEPPGEEGVPEGEPSAGCATNPNGTNRGLVPLLRLLIRRS